MPTKTDRVDCLVDTSAAIAFVQTGHRGHEATVPRLSGRAMGLAGHAVFETFSVLTRLPSPQRLSAVAARRVIEVNFPHSRYLGPDEAAAVLAELADHGITGGSAYDALVGAAARAHGLPLISRDQRAAEVYRAIGVEFELL